MSYVRTTPQNPAEGISNYLNVRIIRQTRQAPYSQFPIYSALGPEHLILYRIAMSDPSSTPNPIPIIICGRRADIARGVKKGLLPEYEGTYTFPLRTSPSLHLLLPPNLSIPTQPTLTVIHVCLSLESATTDLPTLLRGRGRGLPSTTDGPDPNMGTQNYASPPAAVVLGGGFDEAALAAMREACKGVSFVPWLKARRFVSAQEAGVSWIPGSWVSRRGMLTMGCTQSPGYVKEVVERVRRTMERVGSEGGWGKDGVWEY